MKRLLHVYWVKWSDGPSSVNFFYTNRKGEIIEMRSFHPKTGREQFPKRGQIGYKEKAWTGWPGKSLKDFHEQHGEGHIATYEVLSIYE